MWMQPVYQWRFAHMYLKDRPVRWYQPPQAPSYHVSPLIYANEGDRVFQRLDVTPEPCDGEMIRGLTKAHTLSGPHAAATSWTRRNFLQTLSTSSGQCTSWQSWHVVSWEFQRLISTHSYGAEFPFIHSLGTYHLPCAGARTLCLRHCMRRNPRSGL